MEEASCSDSVLRGAIAADPLQRVCPGREGVGRQEGPRQQWASVNPAPTHGVQTRLTLVTREWDSLHTCHSSLFIPQTTAKTLSRVKHTCAPARSVSDQGAGGKRPWGPRSPRSERWTLRCPHPPAQGCGESRLTRSSGRRQGCVSRGSFPGRPLCEARRLASCTGTDSGMVRSSTDGRLRRQTSVGSGFW